MPSEDQPQPKHDETFLGEPQPTIDPTLGSEFAKTGEDIDPLATIALPLEASNARGSEAGGPKIVDSDPGGGNVVDGLETIDGPVVGSSVKAQDRTDIELDITIDPGTQSVISDLRERYLQVWATGSEPTLRDFIPLDLSLEARELLAYELVLIDIDQRARRFRPLSDNVYHSQLPDFPRAIESALTRRSRSVQSGSASNQASTHNRKASLTKNDQSGKATKSGSVSGIRYRPLKMHAKGGLGAVYRAKDSELGRTVALKTILPQHSDNPNSRARFVFEAEVTGSLEHPGIVPVYGLGTTNEGQPYYAMRFIRGESLGDAIKGFHAQHQNISARDFEGREFRGLLRRLIDTSNAIHYAHQRGVLHRDLKPDNVMLGQYGETLVVDWGLAKLMSSREVATDLVETVDEDRLQVSESGMQTSIGIAVGTPMYMSREQALGNHDKLTPASDVYSLGAMLFNLVSGQYPIMGSSGREILLSARDGKSRELLETTASAPRALASICRKAMHREATERYQSAKEFADDIDRWLSDDVVLAHAPIETSSEKLGRWIRRNRSWTVSGAVALVSIAIISIVATWLVNRARYAEMIAKGQAIQFKGEAIDRYEQSRQAIDTWLVQSDSTLQYFPGTQSVRDRLLKVAAEDYAVLAASKSDDPELELQRAATMIRLGDLSQLRNEFTKAREEYDAAMTLLKEPRLSNAEATRRPSQLEIANAQMRVGLSWASEGEIDNADQAYEAAVQTLKSLSTGTSTDAARAMGITLANWAELPLQKNEFATAEERLSLALDWFEKLGAEATAKDDLRIARVEELLGRSLLTHGETNEAVSRFQSARSRLEALVEAKPDDPESLDALASVLISASSIDRAQGAVLRESQNLQEASKHYRALFRAIPDVPLYAENLALTLTDLGLSLVGNDSYQEALAPLGEARDLVSDLRRRYPDVSRYEDIFAANSDVLGQAQTVLGDAASAQQSFAESITLYQSLCDRFPDRPDYYERLAIAQSHYGQATEGQTAIAAFDVASDGLKQLMELFPDVPRYREALGYIQFEYGRFLEQDPTQNEASLTQFRSALETWSSLDEVPHIAERSAWLLATCGDEELRDPARAIKLAKRCVELQPENLRFNATLAICMLANNDNDGADAVMKSLGTEGGQSLRIDLVRSAIAIAKSSEVNGPERRDEVLSRLKEEAPGSNDLRFIAELSSTGD